eukprot:gene9913-11739_t
MSVTMSMPFVIKENYPPEEVECDDCSICLKCLYDVEKENAFQLPCGHVFHFECIDAYKAFKPSAPCPNCRQGFITFVLNAVDPDEQGLTALVDGNGRVTVNSIVKYKHLLKRHKLLDRAYENLVEGGNLSVRNIKVVEADLREHGLLERAYDRLLEAHLALEYLSAAHVKQFYKLVGKGSERCTKLLDEYLARSNLYPASMLSEKKCLEAVHNEKKKALPETERSPTGTELFVPSCTWLDDPGVCVSTGQNNASWNVEIGGRSVTGQATEINWGDVMHKIRAQPDAVFMSESAYALHHVHLGPLSEPSKVELLSMPDFLAKYGKKFDADARALGSKVEMGSHSWNTYIQAIAQYLRDSKA